MQIAATVLGVPLDLVHLCETNTYSIPNTVESGGSFVADINGGAVKVKRVHSKLFLVISQASIRLVQRDIS